MGTTSEAPEHPTVVGLAEIAERLGATRTSVDQWRHKGILPEPSWTIGGRPAWDWRKIAKWARSTGRLPEELSASARKSRRVPVAR